MANSTLSLALLSFIVLVLFFNIGENMAQDFPSELGSPLQLKLWCVAKPSASDAELLSNINYVCNEQGLPCDTLIQPGGPCFEPATLTNHASVVMNLYFQNHGHTINSCDFKGSGLLVVLTDPSFGSCIYNYID